MLGGFVLEPTERPARVELQEDEIEALETLARTSEFFDSILEFASNRNWEVSPKQYACLMRSARQEKLIPD
jgi:hypothetical protein